MTLSNKQCNFIRLIERSPDTGDGWRRVSDNLSDFAREIIAEQPELYETRQVDTHGLYVRLSERGQILKDYV